VARKSDRVRGLIEAYLEPAVGGERPSFGRGCETTDHEDALVCALVAWLFVHERDALAAPNGSAPDGEGWIWAPRDALAEP